MNTRHRTRPNRPMSMMIVGSGTTFFSGISVYTHMLAVALGARHETSVLLMRRLVPRRLYPGAGRVGDAVANWTYPPAVHTYDGVDWFWGPSLIRALIFLRRRRPTVVVFQWWTAAVAHTYLVLSILARISGARILFEVHELQDTGEARIPMAGWYARALLALITPMVEGYVAHSTADAERIATTFRTVDEPIWVIPHGPFSNYEAPAEDALREAPTEALNVTFFGTIRPYKGLEDLIAAFGRLPNPECYWLTVIGETWEHCTEPAEMIAASDRHDRITFVNRYVTDDEAARWLAGADVIVLPYRRSSASGPLHIGMALGLPIITTRLPSLVEAVGDYGGCTFVPANDVDALTEAIAAQRERRAQRYADVRSWAETAKGFISLVDALEERHEVSSPR